MKPQRWVDHYIDMLSYMWFNSINNSYFDGIKIRNLYFKFIDNNTYNLYDCLHWKLLKLL